MPRQDENPFERTTSEELARLVRQGTRSAPDGTIRVVSQADVGYLNLAHAARYLDATPRTLRRWIQECALPYYYLKRPGRSRGKLYFRKREIDAWMRRTKNAPLPERCLDTDPEDR